MLFQAQLYGAFDEVTREWSDGVASECVECRADRQPFLTMVAAMTSLGAHSCGQREVRFTR